MSGQQVTMQALANELTLRLSRPVTDETGLTGNYDFILTFSSAGLNGPRSPVGGANLSPEELEAARRSAGAQAREPKKRAVELIVIDHVEKKPTGN
jgi:uncharacterized protein (TIGR03435 family)